MAQDGELYAMELQGRFNHHFQKGEKYTLLFYTLYWAQVAQKCKAPQFAGQICIPQACHIATHSLSHEGRIRSCKGSDVSS